MSCRGEGRGRAGRRDLFPTSPQASLVWFIHVRVVYQWSSSLILSELSVFSFPSRLPDCHYWYVCEFLDGVGNSSGFTGVKLDPLKHVHMISLIPGYSGQCSEVFFNESWTSCSSVHITEVGCVPGNTLSPSTRTSLEKDKAPECLQLTFQENLEIF